MQTATITWPDPASVTHVYKGSGRDRPRYYRHLTESWELPGVTTVLRAWDKLGIVTWAADIERAAVLEAAGSRYAQALRMGPAVAFMSTPEAFLRAVEADLGDARQHVKKKEQAADVGKAIHERCQWDVDLQLGKDVGPCPQVSADAAIGYLAWAKLWEREGLIPLRTEQPVWSLKDGHAGTADLIAMRKDGSLGVVDLKSSKATYPSQHLQVAAYCEAVTERTGVEVEWAQLWRLPKSTADLSVEIVNLGDLKVWNGREAVAKTVTRDELYRAFLGILAAWRCSCEVA